MAEPDDGPVTASPFIIDPTAAYPANTDLAIKFAAQHKAEMDARQKEIDNVFSKQQLTADSMTKILDDTTRALKESRKSQINLPLMAMAAGMLSSKGNFGQQLGEGLGHAVPTIQKGREDEDAFQMQLAKLAQAQAGIQNAPLQARLEYMKALQTGDLAAQRSIETMIARSQGMNDYRNQALAQRNQQQVQKAVQDALQEARKQVDSMNKEMFATNEEREAEVMRRFTENVKLARAAGVDIPDAVVQSVTGGGASPSMTPGAPKRPTQLKNFYEAPTSPEKLDEIRKAGVLPPPPSGYEYSRLSPDKTAATYAQNKKEFDKLDSTLGEGDNSAIATLDKLHQAEFLMNKYKGLTGWQFGLPLGQTLGNISPQATQLAQLFKDIQLHNPIRGQGAISDYERRLFEQGTLSQANPAATNKSIIEMLRAISNRELERQQFMRSYFNEYGTLGNARQHWLDYVNSKEGRAVVLNEKTGMAEANPNRMRWQDYMHSKWGEPEQKARGGAVKLGSEWD